MDLQPYKNIVAFTASICTILQFLSGMLVCQKYVQKGSTGDTSSFPFISGAVSTTLWLRYGFLIDEPSMIIVNTVGSTLFIAYSATFYLYSIKKSTTLKQIVVAFTVLIAILCYSLYYYESDKVGVTDLMGFVCCTMTIVFFAAPLTSVFHVIKMKSAEVMPYPLILATLITSILWYLYGIIIDDSFVQIPNFLGCVLASLQLSLYCIYPTKYKHLHEEI